MSIQIPKCPFPNPYNHNIGWTPFTFHIDLDIVGHMILDESGTFFKIMLYETLSGDMGYYRGQNQNYPKFKTSWQKQDSPLKKCIAWIAKEEFLDWFQRTPYFTYFANQIEFSYNKNLPEGQGAKFAFDFEAIAQHYGFATNYLDITTKRDIAEFFAYTYWDKENRMYKPIEDFTKFHPVLFSFLGGENIMNPYNKDIRIVGFQPLVRPICQFAMAINLENTNIDYNKEFFKIDLPQEKKRAFEIYDKYEGGKQLFPDDYATQAADMINDKLEYGRNINHDIFLKYCKTFNQNPRDIANRLMSKGYIITNIGIQIKDETIQSMQKHIEEKLVPWINEFVRYTPVYKG